MDQNLVNLEKCQDFVKELPRMARNLVGLQFSRFMLFLVSSGFVIVGTLLGTAAGLLSVYTWMVSDWIDLDVHITLLIVAAAIMMIVAFIGTLAATKESALVANLYWLMLLILFIISVNAAITTSIIEPNLAPKVENNMLQNLKDLDPRESYQTERWSWLQNTRACCGVRGPEDWRSVKIRDGVNYTSGGNTYLLPFSCCRLGSSPSGLACEYVYSGCQREVRGTIDMCFIILGLIAGITIMLQVLGMIFASLHARNIRRFKTTEEMKKQELQHLLFNNGEASS